MISSRLLIALAAPLLVATVACATEPRADQPTDTEYEVVAAYDTAAFSRYTGDGKLRHDTMPTTGAVSGTLWQRQRQGGLWSLVIHEQDHRQYQASRSGDSVVFSFGNDLGNPMYRLTGVFAGDSIVGKIRYEYISSATIVYWGPFIARRIY